MEVGEIVQLGLSAKLNLILDVDHTLIFACDRSFLNVEPGYYKNTHLLRLNGGSEMHLIVRQGIPEMLDYL